jgi:SAM-dependent methyltransferase
MSQFDHPLIAAIYDLDDDRSDLDVYLELVRETGARTLLDVGCGTGALAVRVAARGVAVVALDPAGAMLDRARAKPGADAVTWVHGALDDAPPMQFDLTTMTANTAQVFTTDEAWAHVLAGIRTRLRPGGRLAFETRVPARRAWEAWTRERSHVRLEVRGYGEVESWEDLMSTDLPLVIFRSTNTLPDGEVVTAVSTLRFRERDEIEASLADAGFVVERVFDAPTTPGQEWVFVARAL